MAERKQIPTERKRLQALTLAYDAVARLLPVEGRDFRLELTEDTLRVRITGLTPFGTQFAAHCKAHLQETVDAIIAEQAQPVPTKQDVMRAIAESFKKGKVNGDRNRAGTSTGSAGASSSTGGAITECDEQLVL